MALPPFDAELLNKSALRTAFLQTCRAETRDIHYPIVDSVASGGHLNPAGLGSYRKFSKGLGQTTVAYDSAAAYHLADTTNRSPYGGAEYAIVGTVASTEAADKFAKLHGGAGAVLLPSGAAAMANVLQTFLRDDSGKPAIFIPDNRYFPLERMLHDMQKLNSGLKIYYYSARADGGEVADLIEQARQDGAVPKLIYLEAPGSQTFEIPDLDSIIAAAKLNGIPTAMDNTWASHVRFKPLQHGVDVAIQATTKYEGGYADTPSGVVIAASSEHHEALAFTARVYGAGAVDPERCNRLVARVDSTEKRMDQHFSAAQELTEWFRRQPAVTDILSPAAPDSPDHARFQKYFGKGNGLFTVVFNTGLPREKIEAFLDQLNLFRVGESWGGHVSLALPFQPGRKISAVPQGHLVRFSAGLEHADDLLADLEQASTLRL